jgi:hypothetical protein
MNNTMRWIEKFTGGPRNTTTASETPSARTYTGEEIRNWFTPSAGPHHQPGPSADGYCTMVRRHVRPIHGQQGAAPAPIAALRRLLGNIR